MFFIITLQKCAAGHHACKWRSQPRLKSKGVHARDFLLASSILLSGNNHSKIALMMQFANIGTISESFFQAVQGLYVVPAIEQTYEAMTKEVAQRLSDKKLVLSGLYFLMYMVIAHCALFSIHPCMPIH